MERAEQRRIGGHLTDVKMALNDFMKGRGIVEPGMREIVTLSAKEAKRRKQLRAVRRESAIERVALEIEAGWT